MNRSSKIFSVEDYKVAYKMFQDGESVSQIRKALPGRNHASVSSLVQALERYKQTGKAHHYGNPINFTRALTMLRNEALDQNLSSQINGNVVTDPKVFNTANQPKPDRWRKVEDSYQDFMNSVIDLITEEVDGKVSNVIKENVSLKKQIQEMTPVVQEARKSNLVYNLRRSLGAK